MSALPALMDTLSVKKCVWKSETAPKRQMMETAAINATRDTSFWMITVLRFLTALPPMEVLPPCAQHVKKDTTLTLTLLVLLLKIVMYSRQTAAPHANLVTIPITPPLSVRSLITVLNLMDLKMSAPNALQHTSLTQMLVRK